MSTAEMIATRPVAGAGSVLRQLTILELRRYAKHPLFWIGIALTVLPSLDVDPVTGVLLHTIAPAAGLGVLGLVAMAAMTRKAQTLTEAGGVTPVPERIQTAALALTCLLPFGLGLIWVAWAFNTQMNTTIPANGLPFGPVGDGWVLAVLLGAGGMSTLGGPLLGIVIGRWLPQRGMPTLSAVLLVLAVIVMQGVFEPLRTVRVVMPYTHWGGRYGIAEDPERILILGGSPQWWAAYLAFLCGLAVLAALWHDADARTRRLRIVGALLLAGAVVTVLLAMFTGIDGVVVNPLPGPAF